MRITGLALAALFALAAFPAAAAAQAPPPNDNYLQAPRIPEGDEPLPRNETLRHETDTTNATEQPDIFNPGPGGGGPEVTSCDTTAYGKTVWYRIQPDRPVAAQITANGLPPTAFDPVIAIYEAEPQTLRPRSGVCENRLASANEVLIAGLERGRTYLVQVGGVNSTGGRLETLFDFFPLPTLDATPTLRAAPTPSGFRAVQLRVDAPRGARITVSCTRRACRRLARTAVAGSAGDPWGPIGSNASLSSSRPRAEASRVLTFRNVSGRSLRAGQAIEIRVTQPGFIGRYFKYTAVRGNFRRTTRCLEPGSSRPRRRCG